jgi:hypothetical protein
MGVDLSGFLQRALQMVRASGPGVAAGESPGVVLGAAMGELALAGRDKLTFLMPRQLETLGLWLEQLIAESTGKEGKGILPVAGEPLGQPEIYGDDRLFVLFRLKEEEDANLDRFASQIATAGHPMVTIELEDRLDLVKELFRWEMATAVAGAVLGINPFDQPNVQESKDNTNRLLAMVRERGSLPEGRPALTEGGVAVHAESAGETLAETFSRLFETVEAGQYFAILAYLTEEASTDLALQSMRSRVRSRYGLATTSGYGPRYLHSTGQFHKGGPNTGIFLELTADDTEDMPIPGQPYSFGVFKRAQGLGDLEALRLHGQRAMRVHLGSNVAAGLAEVDRAMERVLSSKGESK